MAGSKLISSTTLKYSLPTKRTNLRKNKSKIRLRPAQQTLYQQKGWIGLCPLGRLSPPAVFCSTNQNFKPSRNFWISNKTKIYQIDKSYKERWTKKVVKNVGNLKRQKIRTPPAKVKSRSRLQIHSWEICRLQRIIVRWGANWIMNATLRTWFDTMKWWNNSSNLNLKSWTTKNFSSRLLCNIKSTSN